MKWSLIQKKKFVVPVITTDQATFVVNGTKLSGTESFVLENLGKLRAKKTNSHDGNRLLDNVLNKIKFSLVFSLHGRIPVIILEWFCFTSEMKKMTKNVHNKKTEKNSKTQRYRI